LALWLTVSIAVAIAWPGWRTVEFLVSGPWIARQWFAPGVAFVLCLGILAAGVFVFWIHALLSPDLRPWLPQDDRLVGRLYQRASIPGLILVAALTAGLTLVLMFRYGVAYLPLARLLLPVPWLLTASIVAASAAWRPRWVRPLLWACLPLAGFIAVRSFGVAGGTAAGLLSVAARESLPIGERGAPQIRLLETVHCGTSASAHASSYVVPASQRRNVILISVDALRADVVGRRGPDGRSLTPNLDSFAAKSRVLTNAQTTYPATALALAGAASGLYPSRILLAPEPPVSALKLLATTLEHAYITLPTDAWFDLPAINELLTQGVPVDRVEGAPEQTRRVVDKLRSFRTRGGRAFVWVHYYEPHLPYVVHPTTPRGPGQLGAYYSEVSFVDAALGDLLAELDRGGWYADSLVVVFADHGQSLGERGYWGHHVYLTRPVVAIPVFLRGPGLPPGLDRGPASLADLAPTVLEFSGIPPLAGIDGVSWLSGLDPHRQLFAEAFPLETQDLFRLIEARYRTRDMLRDKLAIVNVNIGAYAPKVAVISGGLRLIVNRASGARELFDDRVDPNNEHAVVGRAEAQVRPLLDALVRWHAEQSRRIACAAQPSVEPHP
jgi:hypothetical protein